MNGKVFVTQEHNVRDPVTKAFRPKFDLSPALEYGNLVYMLQNSQVALLGGPGVADLINQRLDEEEYDPDTDYLLATGDMTIGMHAAVLMHGRGGCRALRWEGRERRYIVYPL